LGTVDLKSRLQLALNVDDLDEAVTFYSMLFNTPPNKVKQGYANFAVAEPPLKLVLLENPGKGGTINHLGVEESPATPWTPRSPGSPARACSPTKRSAPKAKPALSSGSVDSE